MNGVVLELIFFFGHNPRRKNRAMLLEIAISNPKRSNLNSAARHAENLFADVVRSENNK